MTLDDYLRTHSVSGPAFAERIGVDPATVYRIRKGQVLPHRKTIMAIIQATEGLVGLADFIAVETSQTTGGPAE
ncbi:helix-turn-helix domain-containing protein [Tritonibacter mobilis]|uniref:helix-turn-helix domain-containing protein n=1 Tax=Tritonibacter mobilis TaxID=379347 RepID=UPI0039A4A17E